MTNPNDDSSNVAGSQPANLFDFQDGYGPVPARRHFNGGGWVALSAIVAGSAFVGPNAQVFGNAFVLDRARAEVRARVSGNTRVDGDDQVSE